LAGSQTVDAFRLQLETNGDITVRNTSGTTVTNGTISTPVSADTQHYFEFYFQNSNSGAWELFIDGTSVGSGTGEDFLGATLGGFNFRNPGNLDGNIYFDDFYWGSGATSSADRLSNLGGTARTAIDEMPEVFGYQGGKGTDDPDFDNAGVVGGTTLDFGPWSSVGERPFVDFPEIRYTTTAIENGCIAFDDTNASGDSPGPSSGSDDVSGTIVAASFIWRAQRTGGSGTAQMGIFGKFDGTGNADVSETADFDLTTSASNHFELTELSTRAPLATDDIVMGISKSAGGQDFLGHEMQAFLLHVPDAAAGGATLTAEQGSFSLLSSDRK